jgi:DNA-binding IclR family transcriptional regulator
LIGLAYAGHEEFEKSARLVVGRLADELGEVVDLDIVDRWKQLVVVSANGRGKTYLNVVEGSRYPLPLTASARVLLGSIPADTLKTRIPSEDFAAHDGSTVRLADFVKEISQAQKVGYGVIEGSIDPMIGAVSVPVRNARGQCLAALSVVLPSALMQQGVQELVQGLRGAALELERQLKLVEWPLGEASFLAMGETLHAATADIA